MLTFTYLHCQAPPSMFCRRYRNFGFRSAIAKVRHRMPNPNPIRNPNPNPSYAGPSLWRPFAMAGRYRNFVDRLVEFPLLLTFWSSSSSFFSTIIRCYAYVHNKKISTLFIQLACFHQSVYVVVKKTTATLPIRFVSWYTKNTTKWWLIKHKIADSANLT